MEAMGTCHRKQGRGLIVLLSVPAVLIQYNLIGLAITVHAVRLHEDSCGSLEEALCQVLVLLSASPGHAMLLLRQRSGSECFSCPVYGTCRRNAGLGHVSGVPPRASYTGSN